VTLLTKQIQIKKSKEKKRNSQVNPTQPIIQVMYFIPTIQVMYFIGLNYFKMFFII
jgi:hypothetical protein